MWYERDKHTQKDYLGRTKEMKKKTQYEKMYMYI